MRYRHIPSLKRQFIPLLIAGSVAVALVGAFSFYSAHAQGVAGGANANAAKPTISYKVPPLPNGSAHVVVQPGMSKKDWEDAYKETGRPKFNQSSVKRNGGNVERD